MNPEQQLRYLQIELAKVKQEATQLRKALGINRKHTRRIEKAYEDGLLLAMWFAGGIIPSRRYALLHGFTQPRWENAVALLKMARIITRQRHWVTRDLALIEARLGTARQRAIADPPQFFLRLGVHHQPGAKD